MIFRRIDNRDVLAVDAVIECQRFSTIDGGHVRKIDMPFVVKVMSKGPAIGGGLAVLHDVGVETRMVVLWDPSTCAFRHNPIYLAHEMGNVWRLVDYGGLKILTQPAEGHYG